MNPSAEEPLRQRAYTIMQNKLLRGELRAGDLVSELALAEEIGMSRTPVREAIGRLEFEGLLYKVPRVGTLVRLPGQRELREMYEVREALEGFVASVAAPKLEEQDLVAMDRAYGDLLALIGEMRIEEMAALDESQLQRYFDADVDFHQPLLMADANSRILKIVSEFRVVQRIFEYGRMAYELELVEKVAREHGEILKALQNRDGEAARVAMQTHIRSACHYAMNRFTQLESLNENGEVAPGKSIPTSSSVGRSRMLQRPRRRRVS